MCSHVRKSAVVHVSAKISVLRPRSPSGFRRMRQLFYGCLTMLMMLACTSSSNLGAFGNNDDPNLDGGKERVENVLSPSGVDESTPRLSCAIEDCDPRDEADDNSCPSDQSCQPTEEVPICLPTGVGEQGEACTDSSECALGLSCFADASGTGGHCGPICCPAEEELGWRRKRNLRRIRPCSRGKCRNLRWRLGRMPPYSNLPAARR